MAIKLDLTDEQSNNIQVDIGDDAPQQSKIVVVKVTMTKK